MVNGLCIVLAAVTPLRIVPNKIVYPLLVKGSYGKGRVFAFLGTSLGDEATDAKAFWNDNADYLKTMKGLLK